LAKGIRKAGILILISVIMLMTSGSSAAFNPRLFDTGRIMSTIRELTSKDYNGRMAGTPGGKKTEEFIASMFKNIGLKPAGSEGTYFQEFTGVSGNPSGEYILEVLKGDKVVRKYTYAKDYKFIADCSYSGEVTAKGVQVKMARQAIADVVKGQEPAPPVVEEPEELEDEPPALEPPADENEVDKTL
jgi:hypothetical protein